MGGSFTPSARLPDPRIEVLDERFVTLRLLPGTVECLATGCYWAEGPAWVGDGRHHLVVDAGGPGAYDGIAVDVQGNVWCGFGSNGASGADLEALDGVRVYDAAGVPLAHIHLPERCANLCFGGARNNRLFMAASHSLYALYVNTRGAV
jgi:gluconolactonase